MAEVFAARADAAWELVDDEAVVINFVTRHYYCLSPSATVVWSQLTNGPQTVELLSAALGDAYSRTPADVHDDVVELLAGLVAEGLVDGPVDGVAAPAAAVEAATGYVAPRFDKFGTLEQLIVAGE
jgi:hypothetical protein